MRIGRATVIGCVVDASRLQIVAFYSEHTIFRSLDTIQTLNAAGAQQSMLLVWFVRSDCAKQHNDLSDCQFVDGALIRRCTLGARWSDTFRTRHTSQRGTLLSWTRRYELLPFRFRTVSAVRPLHTTNYS